jgi:hypothetical protein
MPFLIMASGPAIQSTFKSKVAISDKCDVLSFTLDQKDYLVDFEFIATVDKRIYKFTDSQLRGDIIIGLRSINRPKHCQCAPPITLSVVHKEGERSLSLINSATGKVVATYSGGNNLASIGSFNIKCLVKI